MESPVDRLGRLGLLLFSQEGIEDAARGRGQRPQATAAARRGIRGGSLRGTLVVGRRIGRDLHENGTWLNGSVYPVLLARGGPGSRRARKPLSEPALRLCSRFPRWRRCVQPDALDFRPGSARSRWVLMTRVHRDPSQRKLQNPAVRRSTRGRLSWPDRCNTSRYERGNVA